MKIKKIPLLIDWLADLFGLSDIITKQALEIDRLQMQCDIYKELAIIDAKAIRKLVGIDDENN